MSNSSENPRHGRAARCAICHGRFGLVRHYSWRTQLCSRSCVDRLRTRRNLRWMSWFQITDQLPDDADLAPSFAVEFARRRRTD
jgi:hypothetical protein